MASLPFSADYSAITTIGALGSPCTNTVNFFDCNYVEKSASAIDTYIENCKEINKLWGSVADVSPEFSRLLLLGYVSAIESFLRSVFRSIINTDAKAKADAHSYVVPFGAVLYHSKETVAESLLEGISFAGEQAIKSAINKFLDCSNIPEDIKIMLEEFEKICQMRHCCVHRFGKLGTQNGISLGLESHSKALEKPLVLSKDALGNIASWLMSFAKALNNFMFGVLLERSTREKNPYRIDWHWTYTRDRVKFLRIYQLFATTKDGIHSPEAEILYERFRLAKQIRKKKIKNSV
jgi:hypothetical protein